METASPGCHARSCFELHCTGMSNVVVCMASGCQGLAGQRRVALTEFLGICGPPSLDMLPRAVAECNATSMVGEFVAYRHADHRFDHVKIVNFPTCLLHGRIPIRILQEYHKIFAPRFVQIKGFDALALSKAFSMFTTNFISICLLVSGRLFG